jgi:diguanylate cyclase (GGDEF)-like protein/PAS domain S-box-containing protein
VELTTRALHGATAVVALASAVFTLRTWRRVERHRMWLWMGVSATAIAVGHGLIAAGTPSSAWDTAGLLAMATWPIFAGMASWSHTNRFRLSTRFGFHADAALFGICIAFIAWELGVAPRIGASVGRVDQALLLVQLVGGTLCAAVMLLLWLMARSTARALFLVSIVVITAGNLLMVEDRISGDTRPVGVAMSLLGVSAFVVVTRQRGGTALDFERPAFARLALTSAPIAVSIWLALWLYVPGDRPATNNTIIIAGTAGFLLALVQLAAWAQARHLTTRLESNVEALRIAEHDLRDLLDDLPTAVVVLTPEGRIAEANAGTLELTGRSHASLLGMLFVELMPADQRAQLVEVWRAMLAGDDPDSPAFRFDRPDGQQVVLEASVRLPLARPNRVVVELRDITAELEQAAALERHQERFRMAFEDAPTGISLSTMPDSILVDVNQTLLRVLGYAHHELVGQPGTIIGHPEDWIPGDVLLEQLRGDPRPLTIEKRFVRKDGSVLWTNTSLSLIDSGDGVPLVVAHFEDTTARRQAAERLEWAATHDELTQLPNRFRFIDQLAEVLGVAAPATVALLFVDLDNFKVINDSLGHAIGDQVVASIGDRLRSVVRDHDLLGRFGGDEFIVMIGDVESPAEASEVAERLRSEIARPLLVDGGELFITASIGIAISDTSSTTSDLLRNADAAMYRAKARGRDCVEVFAAGGHEATVKALRTTNELRRGLERGEVVPYFQPIVDLSDGRLRGFEVLARWRHPERGVLGPDQFLPMAEETGLIGDVGSAVMRTALSQIGAWHSGSRRFVDLTLSVNVSVRQLMSETFHDVVADALMESGVSADALWLEITESALMSDTKSAGLALRELRSLGLHLAVDDFGTGYSSLTYLKRFPVEAIKIDRSFVAGLGIDNDDSTIVEAVVRLGQSLGLTVVAEGVETPLQLNRLREIQCDFGQGFLFGRPRPADLVTAEYSLA